MKFNSNDYASFSYIKDNVTFSAVLNEGKRKLQYITDLCPQRNVCVQAGCNFGIFAHYFSKCFKQVLTFEPSAKIYKHANANLSSIDNITLINKGLYSLETTCKENFDAGNCGATFVSVDEQGDIPLTTIDKSAESYDACDLIYLDIEGMEYQALLGAAETIKKHKPVLAIENKGLVPEFEAKHCRMFKPAGNLDFRNEICSMFNYKFHKRLMRDDIFIALESE